MVAQGNLVLGGRHFERHRPADVQPAQPPRRLRQIRREDNQLLLAVGIIDHDDILVVVEKVGQAVAHPVALADLHDRAFVVEKGEGLAARGDGQGVARRVEAGAVQIGDGG